MAIFVRNTKISFHRKLFNFHILDLARFHFTTFFKSYLIQLLLFLFKNLGNIFKFAKGTKESLLI